MVCPWIGNSETVAKKHDLQVRDEDFVKALHNPVQFGSVDGGNESYRVQPAQQDSPENSEKYGKSSGVNKITTGADGNRSVRQNQLREKRLGDFVPMSAANSGAVDAEGISNDPRLAWLIEVWPMLSEENRDAIAMLVAAEINEFNDVKALAN